VALAVLVIANLVPLAGVLFFGWDVATILIVYWLENGIVGLFNIPRILFAAGSTPVGADSSATAAGNAVLAVFFAIHYGIFWIGHGVFVVVLTGGIQTATALPSPLPTVAAEPVLLLAAVALLLGHAADLFLDYFGRGEYRTTTAGRQMMEPYPRMVVLHLTIVLVLGGVAVAGFGQPHVLVALLVIGKIVLDLSLFLWRLQTVRARQAQTAAK
jgi:hypothetical protein